MKVLVTGGAGYVGTALCAVLAAQGDEVVVYDNLSRPNYNFFLETRAGGGGRIRFVHGDLLDSRKLGRALEGVEVVYHLAGRVTEPFAHDDVHGYDQVNRWGTAELGYQIERPGSTVRRLVYLSSAAVYGDTHAPASPTTPPAPVSAYGSSKLEGERMLERLGADLELCIVRAASVYGYGKSMRFDAVINRLLFDAHFTGRITLHGSGEQVRSFIHIDAATAVLRAMGAGKLGPGVFHLVERRGSVLDVARVVGALYPEVESIFISQHLRVPDSVLELDPRVPANLLDQRPLLEVLDEARRRFAF